MEHYPFALWHHAHQLFPNLNSDHYSVAIAKNHKDLSILQSTWKISTRNSSAVATNDIKGLFPILMLCLYWAVWGCVDERMDKTLMFVELLLPECV